jgi:RimJ/RimL family protein N-acetyltransferase
MAAELRTARLLLRQWRDEDLDAFAAMSADQEVMRHLLPLPDRAASDAWATRARAHWTEHGFGQWIVEVPGAAPVIGVVGLARIAYEAPFTPAVELAWRLAKPWWGRGYATESARATIDYGFTQLGLDELIAVTVPANRASRAVMERLGMTHDPDEDFDHPRVPPGPLQRHVLYRLRRREMRE